MKKLFSLLFLSLLIGSIFATPITQKQAVNAAQKYYSFRADGVRGVNVESVYANSHKGLTTYYVVNFKEGGFVIISADDRVKPILAYSLTGQFDQNITNAELAWWMESYNTQIEYIVTNDMSSLETKKMWNNIITENFAKGAKAVTPLLTTNWDQESGYNDYCPVTYTGCVATAMAQIMNYHEYPVTGTSWHSYEATGFGLQTAFFASGDYEWANMPDDSGNDAVAWLMYHCGVSVDMGYTNSGSGAQSSDVPMAMANYFGYDQGIDYVEKADYTDPEWVTLLKNELDASRPIYYSGDDGTSGHAFVFDGYNSSDEFHVNWGWSGNANAYYAVGSLNGGGYTPNENNAAVIGIQAPVTESEFLWVRKHSDLLAASAYPGYIDAVNEDVAWSIARDGSGGGANFRIYSKTTDGGATWEGSDILDMGGTSFSMIQGLDENTAYISMWGDGNDNHILRTTDGGENWESILDGAGASSFFNVVHFFNENDGFSQGDPEGGEYELYTTTDGGDNWTRVDGANIPDPTTGEFGITGHYTAVGNVIWFTTNKGRIYKSLNKGYNWEVYEVYTGTNGTYIDVAFSDNASNGIAHVTETDNTGAGVGDIFYSTTDGGETWTEITSHTGNMYADGLSSVPGVDNMFVSVGAEADPDNDNFMGMSYTTDGGATWTDYAEYYQNYQVITVDMVNIDKGFAGTFKGDISGGMFILGEPKSLIANFEADITTSCISTNITFTNTSIGIPTTYDWNFGEGAIPATANTKGPHVVQYSTGGYKTVTLTISDETKTETVTMDNYISVAEATPIGIDLIYGEINVNPGSTHTYSVTAQPNCTYNWSDDITSWTISSADEHASEVNYNFAGFGTTGNITVEAVNGCGTGSSLSLTINPPNNVLENNNQISIYPNPAKNYVNIENAQNSSINIYNAIGVLVYTVNSKNETTKIDVSSFDAGIYFLEISNQNETVKQTITIVK